MYATYEMMMSVGFQKGFGFEVDVSCHCNSFAKVGMVKFVKTSLKLLDSCFHGTC
jgi:hypothetical protein